MDRPIRLGFAHGLDGPADDVDVGSERRGPQDVVLLVPAGGGQHVVAVERGIAHAPVQRHEQIELLQQNVRSRTS